MFKDFGRRLERDVGQLCKKRLGPAGAQVGGQERASCTSLACMHDERRQSRIGQLQASALTGPGACDMLGLVRMHPACKAGINAPVA